jgi:hypothetical protein
MSAALAATAASNLSKSKYAPVVIGVLVVGGVLASYFFVIKPILEGLGIKDTKYDKRLWQLNGFDPNYYKTNYSKVTISTAMAGKLATDIWMSYGLINDDEEKLIGAVQSAGSNYNLSKVADVFNKQFGKDMATYVKDFANNSDTEAMYKIINDWKS